MPSFRTGLAVAAACAAVTAAAFPAQAPAYVVDGRPWPGATIAYHTTAGAYAVSVDRAARAWNRANVGVRFVRVPLAGADVVVAYGGAPCSGESRVGFAGRRSRPAVVRLGRGCGPGLTVLLAVHELGHVLGLGHENRRCARMNPAYDDTGTPSRCRHRSLRYWLAHPLLPDDVTGARAVTRETSQASQP